MPKARERQLNRYRDIPPPHRSRVLGSTSWGWAEKETRKYCLSTLYHSYDQIHGPESVGAPQNNPGSRPAAHASFLDDVELESGFMTLIGRTDAGNSTIL
ncbi:hypothetical protein C8R44DRAFT_886285 [Mycena epipterygia]|nr:hypothetical protein C8R44DRAFT_886285 [Mycena epipterygia]